MQILGARKMFIESASKDDIPAALAWGDILLELYRTTLQLGATVELLEEIECLKTGKWKGKGTGVF